MDQSDTEPVSSDDAAVVAHLSADLRGRIRALELDGASVPDAQTLDDAAAIVDAFAKAGLLEFAYLPPEDVDAEGYATFTVTDAEVIDDNDETRDVVTLSGPLSRVTEPIPAIAFEPEDR